MKIVVNGHTHEVPDGTTIAALLEKLDVTARHLAVEVNMELVPRARHAQHRLQDQDQLEVVSLVGGG